MKNKLFIAGAFVVSTCFLQSCGNANNKSEMNHDMMQSMNHAMEKMHDMKMTGDFDLDFAHMMIIHHQAAIEMSEVEIAKGTDAQIKSMAKNIVTAQKDEIEQLQQFIENYKQPEVKTNMDDMHHQLNETMKAMMVKMNNLSMSGNTDKDFVLMMIPHHESAVTMAQDELTHGQEPGLKKMAQKMIDDQTREIGELRAWSSKQ